MATLVIGFFAGMVAFFVALTLGVGAAVACIALLPLAALAVARIRGDSLLLASLGGSALAGAVTFLGVMTYGS